MCASIGVSADARLAFCFPGQGSQAVGMGRAFHEASASARDTFEEASDALGFDIAKLCFEGPEAELQLTANTQPAVLTVSVAGARLLAERGLAPAVVGGHSLGEYSALVAAGALAFADAVTAVRRRGEFMQEAVPVGTGAMAAILGVDVPVVEEICRDAADGDVLDIASGDGVLAELLSPHANRYICIDTSARVVAAAGERLRRFPNVEVREGDMHALPFKDAKERWNDHFERRYVAAVWAAQSHNVSRSAEHAGLSRRHFRELLYKHGLLARPTDGGTEDE